MSEKYAYINSEEGNYPVSSMCQWADLSRSGYYAWLNRGQSKAQQHREDLKILIRHFFKESGQTHGYRRIHETLVRHGVKTCPEVVRRLMSQEGLKARRPRGKAHTTATATRSTEPG